MYLGTDDITKATHWRPVCKRFYLDGERKYDPPLETYKYLKNEIQFYDIYKIFFDKDDNEYYIQDKNDNLSQTFMYCPGQYLIKVESSRGSN
jgi:hypothetical protein